MTYEAKTGEVKVGNLVYGHVSETTGKGFQFIPATNVHRTSRKHHESARACIPSWVRKADQKARGTKDFVFWERAYPN